MNVSLIAAVTVDGFIARNPEHFTDWTDIEDKNFFHEKTKEIGTIIMGANTWRTIRRPFDGRRMIVMSTSGDIAEPIPGQLEFFSGEPKDLLKRLAGEGVTEVALVGGSEVTTSFLLDDLIDEMYVTVTPLLFGQGISLLSGHDFDTTLELIDTKVIGEGSTLLHYRVRK